MCKFHILGMCMKGENCHFAHEKEQMSCLPDLYRTKLCKTLINTGHCEDPNCRYAHNKEELRLVPGFNASSTNPSGVSSNSAEAEPTELCVRCVGPDERQPASEPQAKTRPKAPQAAQTKIMPAVPQMMVPPMQQSQPVAVPGGQIQVAAIQHMISSMDLYTQAAMLQMGQAAQAHVAEAVRLQAIAASLGAGAVAMPVGANTSSEAAGSGAVASAPNQMMTAAPPYFMMPMGAVRPPMAVREDSAAASQGFASGGYTGMSSSNSMGGTSTAGTSMQAVSVVAPASGLGNSTAAPEQTEVVQQSMTMPAVSSASTGLGGLSKRSPSGTALYALAEAEGPHAAQLPVIGVDPMPDEPIQIEPLSLRSLSSHSLAQLGEDAEATSAFCGGLAADSPEGQVAGAHGVEGWAPMSNIKVKNTFIDFDTPTSTPIRGMKSSSSAAARLNSLGEDSPPMAASVNPCDAPDVQLNFYGRIPTGQDRSRSNLDLVPENEGIFQRQQSSASHAPDDAQGAPEKRMQDTPFPGSRTGSDSSLAPACVTPGSDDEADAANPAGSSQQLDEHPLLAKTTNITVKNTFLDFEEPQGGVTGLRTVQTAAGRLDLLCQGQE